MRRKALLVAIVSGLLLTSVFAGFASADVWEKSTSLSIDKSPSGQTAPGDRVLISGRLRPHACEAGKKIRLMEVAEGPNKLLQTDTTDANGEYAFRLHPFGDKKVYVKFRGSVETSYGHSHTCLKSTSDRVLINVSG